MICGLLDSVFNRFFYCVFHMYVCIMLFVLTKHLHKDIGLPSFLKEKKEQLVAGSWIVIQRPSEKQTQLRQRASPKEGKKKKRKNKLSLNTDVNICIIFILSLQKRIRETEERDREDSTDNRNLESSRSCFKIYDYSCRVGVCVS